MMRSILAFVSAFAAGSFWPSASADAAGGAMIDGETRNLLADIRNMLGGSEDRFRRFLLRLRQEEATATARARLAAWRSKLSRYMNEADHTSGVASAYARMVEPVRGPACPPSLKELAEAAKPEKPKRSRNEHTVVPLRQGART